MFKKSFLISAFLLPLLPFTSVKADAPYYVPGSISGQEGPIGSISSNGVISGQEGPTGSISSSGAISGREGPIGSIDASGNIMGPEGPIGSVDASGAISGREGPIGHLDPSGRVSGPDGPIGSVPPGNRYLAFALVQRYIQQKAQRSQYNQQYAQQRNAEIAAQNAEISRQNYNICKEAYQLCQKPYEEILPCADFEQVCVKYQNQVIADYVSKGAIWHHEDCQAKEQLCLKGNTPLSCRPYWSYCPDYDKEKRQGNFSKKNQLPSLSTRVENKTLNDLYQPCTLNGKVALLDARGILIAAGRISNNNTLSIGEDLNRVGTIDEAGHITADKHISHKEKNLIKKTLMLGQILNDGNFLRCGSHQAPRRIGFADFISNYAVRDNLGARSPQTITHLIQDNKKQEAYWNQLYLR